MNLANWLKPALDDRANDTLREIADAPTTVEQSRGGAVLGYMIVRIIPKSLQALSERSADAQTTIGRFAILAPHGADLRRMDRLSASGGVVYLITYVAPGQQWRVEADAEVLL